MAAAGQRRSEECVAGVSYRCVPGVRGGHNIADTRGKLRSDQREITCTSNSVILLILFGHDEIICWKLIPAHPINITNGLDPE